MISRLICWLIGHDSPRVGTPATDFTCKRCGCVPEYCVIARWPAREVGPGLVRLYNESMADDFLWSLLKLAKAVREE